MFIRGKKNKIKFKIDTLGCKISQYNFAVLKNLLLSGNFILFKNDKSENRLFFYLDFIIFLYLVEMENAKII
jgi:hypothetical protein